ncbi:uncharacterized protein C2orf66 homolog [Trichomycterus rosablanca]|uniref:uncharacterized protein C2orf66 homolog n=1 Tax=Trichomycterus rosablanca TaxID=2290929 RepID=UPI002F35A1AF
MDGVKNHPQVHLELDHTSMLTVLVLAALLVGLGKSHQLSAEEWKSLNNPTSRMLFFQIMQSYLDGREAQTGAGNIRTDVLKDGNSNVADSAFDNYKYLDNSIFELD